MGNTTIAVLEEVTQVVEIVLPGPQGPVGDIHPSMPGLVQQATDAATSATASALSADTSEANASASAAAALASKDAAAASEASALASKNAAATSATSASGSATTATTKASEASTSATNAADSATAAATSATDTANALVGERSAVATLTNKTITSPVIDSGAANGVTYLTGSKVLTAGSGLTYNGSALQINAESYPSLKLGNAAGVSKGELYFGVGGDDLNLVSYVAGPIVFKPGNAEQMRLTSTGLGIGTSSPISRLHVTGDVRATGNLILVGGAGTPEVQFFQASRNWTIRNNAGSLEVYDSTASAVRATFNASGNLGLGVTPSAWGSLSALHVKGTAHFAGFSSGAEGAFVTSNAYFNGTSWIYQMTAAASHFRQSGGAHQWFTAPSGTAGQPISLTQAMTLSASGGLMVGTSTDYGERLHVSSAGAGDVISMRIAASQENGSNGMARRIQWSLRDSTGSLINTNSIRSEWSDVGANSAKLVFTSAANNAQADAMTLTASGHLLIGATSSDGVGSARAQIGNASAATTGLLLKSTTSSTSLYASSTSSSYLTWKTGTFMAFGASPDNLGTFAEYARIDSSGNLLVGKTAQSSGGKLEVAGNVVCRPSTAAPTLAVNGEMSFQLVSDTSLKILVRGSDGITRSTTLTLT